MLNKYTIKNKNKNTKMKYNTEKNKHILLPVETKERLDAVVNLLVRQRLDSGDKKLKVSYSDAIKWLLEISNTGI